MMISSSDELLRDGADPAVIIDQLRVIRGKRLALQDVSVRVACGTITGLLGPSGSGKTTLIRCIVGSQIIASGSVSVLGQPAGSAELRHRVGYMPQDPTIYNDLRVIDNIRYFAELCGVDRQAADEVIEAVDLRDHRTARCANLSGGQRARVSLACALVGRPDSASARRADHRPGSGIARRIMGSVHGAGAAWHHAVGVQPRNGRGRPLRRSVASAPGAAAGPHNAAPSTKGNRMHITGGSVSVHRPTHHHRARGRLTLQNYTATTARILRQLAADHRSVAMILLVPILIITLMYFMFENVPHRPGTPSGFNTACLVLLGLFPLFVMFVITAITMQRERASGTLERILTTPLRRLDLLAGYGTAFSIAAAAQATLACIVAFWFLGFDTAGSPVWVFAIAIVNAVLGVGLGLLCSAFARTEFQAVQFIPLVMVPQLLLAGIIVPRALMPTWLEWISNVMPASYALEALQQVGAHPELTGIAVRDVVVVLSFAVASLCLAAVTLRRRTS